MAASDATPMMMGPPQLPDHPILTWQEFCADYTERFFCPEGDGFGRLFVICAEQRDIGCISYDGLENWRGIAELDIWIGSSTGWGHGWGSSGNPRIVQPSTTPSGGGVSDHAAFAPERTSRCGIPKGWFCLVRSCLASLAGLGAQHRS